mmetsp:Transcript_32896/g.79970  ORF Transcript_32896/g.79970 Transcript_32896/m.79970 type:complete len:358 (+) Transcript_32896:169-1242(+)
MVLSSSVRWSSSALGLLLAAAALSHHVCFLVDAKIDSINMDLQDKDSIDLSMLGTQDLFEQYGLEYDLSVDDTTCQYFLKVDFQKNPADVPGDRDFTGNCDPSNAGNVAPDGLGWHVPRRRWLQFPKFVKDTTGFDHMSMYWIPCGREPLGYRQARYDLNFYTVIPQYRAFWTCQEYRNPAVCQPDQPNHLGRGFFSLPRLEGNPNVLANVPLKFQPDPNNPEAFQYEGLISYKPEKVPQTSEGWDLPYFQMSTYDADTVSWRAMIPHYFIDGANSSRFEANQFYSHQTQLRLPAGWNLTYTSDTGQISMLVYGSAGMCGDSFDEAKDEEMIEIEIGVGSVEGGPSRRRARGVRGLD